MDIDFIAKIAEKGFGYLLFAGSLMVIFYLYKENKSLAKENRDLADTRVEDLKEVKDSYIASISNVKTVAETTLSIVKNMQTVLNSAGVQT